MKRKRCVINIIFFEFKTKIPENNQGLYYYYVQEKKGLFKFAQTLYLRFL